MECGISWRILLNFSEDRLGILSWFNYKFRLKKALLQKWMFSSCFKTQNYPFLNVFYGRMRNAYSKITNNICCFSKIIVDWNWNKQLIIISLLNVGILLSQYLVFWYSCIFGNMVIWNIELDQPVIHNFRNFQFSPNITTILIIAQLNWVLLSSLFPFFFLYCLHTLLTEPQVFCAVMSPTASTWAHKISSPTFPLSAAAAGRVSSSALVFSRLVTSPRLSTFSFLQPAELSSTVLLGNTQLNRHLSFPLFW